MLQLRDADLVKALLCPHLIKGADFIIKLCHLAALQGL